jgi:hypothetical protein
LNDFTPSNSAAHTSSSSNMCSQARHGLILFRKRTRSK